MVSTQHDLRAKMLLVSPLPRSPLHVQRRIPQIFQNGNIPMGVYMLTWRVDVEPLNIL